MLEKHDLPRQLFAAINALLSERGQFLREGTIVDATILSAPPSTKNKTRERDPEMHQTKKGNAWHFGRKAHVGVDLGTGLVHTVVGTAANVSDVSQAHRLLHGEEKLRLGDAGYQGVEKRPEMLARFGRLPWTVAAKRGKIRAMAAKASSRHSPWPWKRPRRRCAPWSSIPSTCSRTSLATARRATKAWPRTRRNSTRFLRLANLVLVGRTLHTEVQA